MSSYHHGDLKRVLLEAAAGMLERGEEISLRAAARAAGVSHTAPYHHFADRRALLAGVAEQGFRELGDALLAAAGEGLSSRALLGVGVGYVGFAVGNPGRFRLMFSGELSDKAGLPDLADASRGAYDVLRVGMRRLLGPEPPQEQVEMYALEAWSTVHGLSMLLLDGQVPGWDGSVAGAERIARAVLQASHPTGTPPPAG